MTTRQVVGRLFWTFPDGLPGAGLLLLRLALSSGLLVRCLAPWPTETGLLVAACVAECLAALLICVGLGTPVAAAAAAVIELGRAYTDPEQLLVHALLATLGAALALIGPGAFSVDACLFGWRRIEVPASKGPHAGSN